MTAPVPPVARRVPLERRHHGDLVVDQYEWLRQKEEPEVIAHLEAENAYTDALLAPLAPLRERLFDEIYAEPHQELKRQRREHALYLQQFDDEEAGA